MQISPMGELFQISFAGVGRYHFRLNSGINLVPFMGIGLIHADLARIIHERFYCNRGFADATHLAACFTAPKRAGSPLGRLISCFSSVRLNEGVSR